VIIFDFGLGIFDRAKASAVSGRDLRLVIPSRAKNPSACAKSCWILREAQDDR
jgi:hypothetical protein